MDFIKRRKAINAAFGPSSLSNDGVNCAVRCPSCNENKKNKQKLVIRLDDGRYQCWVCGIKGNNIVYYVAKKKNAFLDLVADAFQKKIILDQDNKPEVTLPKDAAFILANKRDPYLKSATKYLY